MPPPETVLHALYGDVITYPVTTNLRSTSHYEHAQKPRRLSLLSNGRDKWLRGHMTYVHRYGLDESLNGLARLAFPVRQVIPERRPGPSSGPSTGKCRGYIHTYIYCNVHACRGRERDSLPKNMGGRHSHVATCNHFAVRVAARCHVLQPASFYVRTPIVKFSTTRSLQRGDGPGWPAG